MDMLGKLAAAFDNLLFDMRFGTSTRMRENLQKSEVESANLEHAVPYVPTQGRVFKALMSAIELPPGGIFVDVGAGKGKVLLLATEYDFQKIIGVEFSARLCAIARDNIERYSKLRYPAVKPVVHHADIVDYPLSDENIFFMYNPFHTAVMEAFLARIDQSLSANPRDAWIIYHQPFTPCRSAIETAGFGEVQWVRLGKAIFRIYWRGRETAAAVKATRAII